MAWVGDLWTGIQIVCEAVWCYGYPKFVYQSLQKMKIYKLNWDPNLFLRNGIKDEIEILFAFLSYNFKFCVNIWTIDIAAKNN